jgi:CheY-like chemotaxis protein
VLFTSGYPQGGIVHGGRLDAGLELLSKPYRREDLARKVGQMLSGRRAGAESEQVLELELESRSASPSESEPESESGTGPGTASGAQSASASAAQARPASAAPLPESPAVVAPAAPAAQAAAVAPAVSERRPLHVLVVEDNADARQMVCEVLAQLGHTVSAAADGEAAWASLAEREIDVLFTDVSLPGMSGISLARQVLRRSPATRVVLASGYGLESLDGLGFPAVFLRKPYEFGDLQGALEGAE